ncbi:protein MAINTENANCE OF MERISTEMS-like [Rhododendron vialii]|uniref:protein MAINTENANCE OF MERISTEMS-like n=1 Tax=Rhododendron vialii TaxID=182163 RepID=UPI00265FA68C|nr:protein MAINTENANCE OF MERISTEMS-like [Rhododendron vialii]
MTVTPLDFAAITGLRVGGDPIPYDSSLVLDDAALRWFLGRVPRHSGGMAAYEQFVEYWDHEPATDEEVAQMARAYLVYMFGASLFPNRRSWVHLCYLAGLADLGQAGRFDWGGAALCTLYCLLGAASRGVGDTVGGYWRVFELWAYEVLGMFPPENTCTDPNLLPRGLAWGKAYRRAKERRGEVMTFRRWLDNLIGVVVHWDRWAGMEADFLPRSREVTRSRVLLECPLGWQWYLGDRVTRQSLGLPAFAVPGLLPPRVQRTESYTCAELELFTVPDTDLERHLRRSLDYAAYADRCWR